MHEVSIQTGLVPIPERAEAKQLVVDVRHL